MKTLVTVAFLFFAALSVAAASPQQLNAASGEALEIELRHGGSIVISGWNRNAVSVDAGNDQAGIEVRRTNGGVAITQTGPRRQTTRVAVQVPHRFDLELKTMGGSISVDNVAGDLDLDTKGGEIKLSRIGGKIKGITMGGNVTLRDSRVDGKVKSHGGQVLIENVTGNVSGSTMGGNVTYRGPVSGSGGTPIDISTMGGNILVETAPDGATVSTMGGNIVVNDSDRLLEARTMGGNITATSSGGSVEAVTMGGNVAMTLTGSAGGRRDVTIESKGGDVELVVPAGFPMDLDIEIVVTKNSARRFAIESDFPVTITPAPEAGAHRIIRGRGRSGAGTHKVRIRTMDGDVKLLRRD